MSSVSFRDVDKSYDGKGFVVKGFNLDVKDGEFIVFVGPSGCGKSTILRMVAGLEEPTTGKIYIGEKCINNVEPKDRNIAMVFQNHALYPHMSVQKNLEFPLIMKKIPRNEIKRRVGKIVTYLRLGEFLNKKPKELTNKQKQLVSLGRAMVKKAEVFLLDEPLSSLDRSLKEEVKEKILDWHKFLEKTFIYVTSDPQEAMAMGERIVVLRNGCIQQIGAAKNLYKKPKSIFVAKFFESPFMNFLNTVLLEENNSFFINIGDVKFLVPQDDLVYENLRSYLNREIIVGIRPHDIYPEDFFVKHLKDNVLKTKIEFEELRGFEKNLYFYVEEERFVASVSSEFEFDKNEEVELYFNTEKMYFFDKNTEKLIC